MTPERCQSPVELLNSEGDSTAPSSGTNNQIRVKNVSEINSNEADAIPNTPTKRKLPSWMLVGSSSNSKKIRNVTTENEHLQEEHTNGQQNEERTNGQADEMDETVGNGDSMQIDAENPELSHTHASTSNEPSCNPMEGELTSSTSTSAESLQNVLKEEPSACSTSEHSCSSVQEPVKPEPTENDEDCNEAVGQIMPASPRNIKPAIKVEKEEATSSTSRNSCQYGIRCYRRNPMHRIEEAHPGDKDYKRPDFPTPPLGTPSCPYGDSCYRRNPTHFQQFSHPPSTDFEQNWKNYKLRLRQRQRPPMNDTNSSLSDLDEDDDNEWVDPFIDDSDLDQDFVPSDLDEEVDDENDFDE